MKWKARVLVREGEAVWFEDWTDSAPPDYYKFSQHGNFEEGVAFDLDQGTWYAVDYDDGEPS